VGQHEILNDISGNNTANGQRQGDVTKHEAGTDMTSHNVYFTTLI